MEKAQYAIMRFANYMGPEIGNTAMILVTKH